MLPIIGIVLIVIYCLAPFYWILVSSLRPDSEIFDEVVREIEKSVAPSVHVVRPGVAAVAARGVARFYGDEVAAA
ncbi:hypothetical protein LRP60_11880, partial [Cutibacterium acnes]|nr:hypothetical protein [Cutibacterium acnes]